MQRAEDKIKASQQHPVVVAGLGARGCCRLMAVWLSTRLPTSLPQAPAQPTGPAPASKVRTLAVLGQS